MQHRCRRTKPSRSVPGRLQKPAFPRSLPSRVRAFGPYAIHASPRTRLPASNRVPLRQSRCRPVSRPEAENATQDSLNASACPPAQGFGASTGVCHSSDEIRPPANAGNRRYIQSHLTTTAGTNNARPATPRQLRGETPLATTTAPVETRPLTANDALTQPNRQGYNPIQRPRVANQPRPHHNRRGSP